MVMTQTDVPTHSILYQSLLDIELPRISQLLSQRLQPKLLHNPLLLRPRIQPHALNSHSKRSAHRSMIAHIRLVSSIMQLLHTFRVSGTPKHTVAPSRHPFFLARVKLVGAAVVFVGGGKGERSFAEGAEAEPAVVLHFFEELIVCVQGFEVAGLDGRDHGVTALVNAIV